MNRSLILLTLILLIFVPLRHSNASFIDAFRKLAGPTVELPQNSPSPSPDPSISLNSGEDDEFHNKLVPKAPAGGVAPVAEETCDKVSNSCHDQHNMSACLLQAAGGYQGMLVGVQNGGDNSLNVTITILPGNSTFDEIDVPSHQVKKINVSENVGGSSSFVLNAGHGDCVIPIGAAVPKGYLYDQFPDYANYMTPTNGAYILVATAMIIAVLWACCKFGQKERQLAGIPYQELEMEQQEPVLSTNVETIEGWDQDWDDDWDEEKAVKPVVGNHIGNGQANGHTVKSSGTNRWENDWDD